jgi:metal transporter CNNM
MSLDETQLSVLSISGTPYVRLVYTSQAALLIAESAFSQQKHYANKIKPIRKNGHLLLVTLLLANMIVNETLPVISDPVLGGGVQSVVVSTVLIVMCV